MFLNCNNLEYVNIRNYKPSKKLGSSYYFNESPKNLVVCTEDKDLIDIIKSHDCNIVNCLDNWSNYRKKINKENDTCTDNCYLTSYKYEYNYECYPNCKIGTYNNNYILSNNYIYKKLYIIKVYLSFLFCFTVRFKTKNNH